MESLNYVINNARFSEPEAKASCWDLGKKGQQYSSNTERDRLLLDLLRSLLTQRVCHCPQSQKLKHTLLSFWHSPLPPVRTSRTILSVFGEGEGRSLSGDWETKQVTLIQFLLVCCYSENFSGAGDRKSPFSTEEQYGYSKYVCVTALSQPPSLKSPPSNNPYSRGLVAITVLGDDIILTIADWMGVYTCSKLS